MAAKPTFHLYAKAAKFTVAKFTVGAMENRVKHIKVKSHKY